MPMNEPKPMASLSSGLLARKGDAHPAIRRAYVPLTSITPLPVPSPQASPSDAPRHDSDIVGQQQRRIARSFAKVSEHQPVKGLQTAKTRTAFTLRLDTDRHLRLRLVSAVENRSAQSIVTQALDAFLARQPGLETLVDEAKSIISARKD